MALCRLRIPSPSGSLHKYLSLNPSLQVSNDVRLKWTENIIRQSREEAILNRRATHLHDWDFILNFDGSVENAAQNSTADVSTAVLDSKETPTDGRRYSASYQLPQVVLNRLDNEGEKITRTEQFALGSILYTVATSKKPFDERSDEEIHDLFTKGEFPADTWNLPTAKSILCHWCPEFAAELHELLTARSTESVQNNSVLSAFQVLGMTVSVAALITVPVLGAVGFTAIGPLAGSAAAAWQSGIGAVSAGSIFAWCQSVAMGGAAVGSLWAAGVSGLTVAAGATALQALEGNGQDMSAEELKEKFEAVWKKHNG